MMQNIKLDSLIEISNYIGNNSAYIQGGGGNTSYKNSEILYVKASGTLLKNMSINSGIAEIELNSLNRYLENPDSDENIFASKVKSYCLNNQKPSIETGLHAVIPYNYVIHSHSVYANVVTCAGEADEILYDLFKNEYVFVPYATPGVELIKAYLNVYKLNKECKVIFLQNHGVVSFSNDPLTALKEHYLYSEKIKEKFKLNDFNETTFKELDIKDFLFPDQIVYSINNTDKISDAYKETIKAYIYIRDNIKKIGLHPNYLSEKNIASVLGMDSEKYRASIMK